METEINKLLTKLAIAHRIANEKAMNKIGLHAGQVQILCSLWEKDGQSQAELVRDLCVSPPTINKMVSRLTEEKFVRRKKCPKDQRLSRVYLTKKGQEIRESANTEWKTLEKQLLMDLAETEIILLPILLERLNTNITRLITTYSS